jgi:hypothetical protein
MMSKLFTSIGHENSESEKDTLQKIFRTIDTDGTGNCSIEELTVRSNAYLILAGVQRDFRRICRAGLPEEALLHARRDRGVHQARGLGSKRRGGTTWHITLNPQLPHMEHAWQAAPLLVIARTDST